VDAVRKTKGHSDVLGRRREGEENAKNKRDKKDASGGGKKGD